MKNYQSKKKNLVTTLMLFGGAFGYCLVFILHKLKTDWFG